MDRAAAIRRLDALRQITVERGATKNEAMVAARKARELTARYGLSQPRRPRQRAKQSRRARPMTVQPIDAGFVFNFDTGEHSKNVKVHSHRDRGNWRIEIFQ